MARKPTGQLYENRSKVTGKVTSYGVRFRHGGKRRYVTLDVANRREAEAAMTHLMADVQRGLWTAPEDRAPEPEPQTMPTFAEFASEWFHGRVAEGLSEKGQQDVLWRLGHLRHLGPVSLDRIGVEDVDRLRRAKLSEGRLSPSSINKLIATLGAVLEVAVEYEHVPRNVAKGKRRRLRVSRPARTYLDRAEHVAALLDAAGTLDASGRDAPHRRPLLAVLVFAGLRIGEALDLRWRDVDLAGGRLRVHGTKTAAASRTVEILPALRDELLAYAAACRDRRPDGLVFGTAPAGDRYPGGAQRSPSNVRNRVLGRAVEDANATLSARGVPQLPDGLTPHSLRRTFASILVALGHDPAVVMRQMGHTTPHMTLGVYAAAMDWADGERERLRALVEGTKWQEMGNTDSEALDPRPSDAIPVQDDSAV